MRVRAVLLVLMAGAVLLLGACEGGGQDPAEAPESSESAESGPSSAPGGSAAEPSEGTATSAPSTTTSLAPVSKVFDPGAMQASVQRILTESYRVEGLEGVTCPPDQPVEVGLTFDCTVQIAGEQKRVRITVKSEDDEYEVGYPE
ncbi:DUF4333 domain-containing protein [Prauserella cavernicola]|uniref:DUF4333 domain-containing protein n=1 Tax=Prauserella cavernicola TaxID=2800127 RepID=A0A934QLJ7_9PSEU|nr:DUF4333 domain-containing protein [Prauserella cavernicola]MBK1782962.1 DUF4333 domain-containing protein [Prauserella cavernicola]